MFTNTTVQGPLSESLSPYKLAVLLFLNKYHVHWKIQQSDSEYTRIKAPGDRRAAATLLFKIIQGGDLPCGKLCELLRSSALTSELVEDWQRYVFSLMKEGLDGMTNLFEVISNSLKRDNRDTWYVFTTSIVGLFMRHMYALFKRLHIFEIVKLHKDFVEYCKPFLQQEGIFEALMKADVTMSPTSLSFLHESTMLPPVMDISMYSAPSSPSLLESSSRAEMRLHLSSLEDPSAEHSSSKPSSQQIQVAVTDVDSVNVSMSTDVPTLLDCLAWSAQKAELFINEQAKLLEFNERKAMSPRLLHQTLQHILSVYPHLSAAHYLCSLNYLRVSEVRSAVDSLSSAYDCQQVTQSTPRTLRYAALNMAALFSHFGCRSVALRCVSEAIAQSQESGDSKCLQYALAWLYSLAQCGEKNALLETAVRRSDNLQLPYLSWLAVINQAAYDTTRSPLQHLKSLLGCVDGRGVAVGAGSLWGVEAGVWGQWLGGSSMMAVICSQLVLLASPTLPMDPSVPYAGSDTAAALCNMALAFADSGEYELCSSLLSYVHELFPHTSAHARCARFTEAHVTCTHSMLLGDFARALQVLKPIAGDHPVYVAIRSCEVAVAQGDSETALLQVTNLLEEGDVQNRPQLKVIVELLYASALCVAGNFSVAVNSLVSTVALALEQHLALLHSLASLQLLAVQLQLGLLPLTHDNPDDEYKFVRNPNVHTHNYFGLKHALDTDALDQCVAVVLSSGSMFDRARTKLLLAKLRILASKGQPHKLIRVAQGLEEVKKMFAKVEAHHRVRDSLYLMARVYHEAGQFEARNKSALEFRTLENMLPCKAILPPTPLF